MKKYIIFLAVNYLILSSNIFAYNFDNQLVELSNKKLINYKESFEVPSMFDNKGRIIRFRTVFQTGIPCPVYETWRTKESQNGKNLRMHLQFKQSVDIGTILAFAGSASPTKFIIEGKNIASSSAGGVVVAPSLGKLNYIDFVSTSLNHRVTINWGSGKNKINPDKLFYYQFALEGIYGIKDKRINIASFASVKVSGISLRRNHENIERSRNSAGSLNDGSTYNYWRSNILKKTESAKAELTFPKALTIREIGLYIGFNLLFKEMPSKVKITAIDENSKSFEFGVFSNFSRDIYTGKHFYLLNNKNPERRIKTLKFNCKPLKDVVFISEIVVLASPEDNLKLSKENINEFEKDFSIPAQNQQYASAIIKNKTGGIIKNILPVSSINNNFTFSWDGTDNYNRVVKPGEYKLQGITRKKIQVLYDSTPYSSAPTPWVTPSRKGGWLSDHVPPSTIEYINNKLWVGAPLAESGDCIMQLNISGKKQWGIRWLNLGGANFIRTYNDKLYVASCGGWIGNKIFITKINPKTKDFKTILKIPIPKDSIHLKNKQYALSGFAVNENYIALAFCKANRIELYDIKSKKKQNFTITSPRGMRFRSQQTLYMISNNKLITLNISTDKKQTIIKNGLVSPEDFIFHNKNIIVVDSGDNKIKVFSEFGKLLKKIGDDAIRKPGRYNHNILSKPIGVAVDDKNQIWVVENSKLPKRISVWGLKSGKFVREYLGPGRYSSGGWLDPNNKDIYYAEGMIFKRKDKNWDLDAIYSNFTSPTYKLLLNMPQPERPIRVNSKLFLVRDNHWANGKIWYGIMDKNSILHPYAAIGSFKEIYKNFKQRPKGWSKDPQSYTFLWYDINKDGEMQWEEIQFIKAKFKVLSWSSKVSKNLDFYFNLNDNQLYKLPAVWKEGLPTYNLEEKILIYKYPKKQTIIALSSLSGKRLLVNTIPLTCLDETTEKILWTYPNPLPSNGHDSVLPKKGEIQHTLNTEGLVTIPNFGDVFLLNGNKGLRYIFSVDGIFIGNLFQDTRLASPLSIETVKRGQDLEKYSLMEESFSGSFARGSDGKIYFSGGKNHHSIYEVTGLESLKHFTKKISFSIKDWENTREVQSKLKAKKMNMRIEASPVINKLSSAINIPSHENEWTSMHKQIVESGSQYKFTYRLALDKDYLYGAFKVVDESKFVNNGYDWKTLFKSGDSINIEFGGNNSPNVDVGDIRLLIAPYKNKNIAVIYRYKTKKHSFEPTIFASPVGKVSIDKVEQLTNAKIKVNRDVGSGYFLQFRIPRKNIPALNNHQNIIYGDVGVIFSDNNGRINQYNMFRYSPLKGIVSDVPSEIRLTPKYWHKFNIK